MTKSRRPTQRKRKMNEVERDLLEGLSELVEAVKSGKTIRQLLPASRKSSTSAPNTNTNR